MQNKTVLIIGAGPAGLLSAAYLMKQGIKTILIEKSIFPRRVVGESLLPISMDHFDDVGLFDVLNQAGFEKKSGVRFIKEGKQFDFCFSEQFTQHAKTWTWQVPRDEFDNLIAMEMIKRGAQIQFDTVVTGVEFNEKVQLTCVHQGVSKQFEGDFLIDASGFGCVLPKLLGMPVKTGRHPNWACYSHVKDVNSHLSAEPQRITFDILEVDLWFWVIPFSNGTTSIGFAGHHKHFDDQMDGEVFFKQMIEKSPLFRDRFVHNDLLFEPQWYKGYSQSVEQLYGDRFILVGNTLEFLDPVFSSGVALATTSAKMATQRIVAQLQGEIADWEGYVQEINQGLDVFKTYVDSWYTGELQSIFFSNQFNAQFQAQICSVLAGYVWDQQNPFVRKHKRAVSALAKMIQMQ